MPNPFPVVAGSFAAGLAAGVTIDAPAVLGLTLALSAAWVVAVLARRRGFIRLHFGAVSALAGSVGCLLGVAAVDRALNAPLRVLLEQRIGGFALAAAERRVDEPVILEGRLLADAAVTAEGTILRVEVRRVWIHKVAEPAAGGVSLGVSGSLQAEHVAEWTAGRMIRTAAILRRPARYLNAGLPDQERALARRGVSLVGSTKSAALIEVIDRGWPWEESAARLRARTRAAMARYVRPLDQQSAAIATAILIGDRAGLTLETERQLQEAGTYHVIAISGGNIAILVSVLLGLCFVLGLRGRLAASLVIGALAAYAIVAAGGPSVLRATAMAAVYLAVRLIDQRTAAANAISVTAVAMLLFDPLQIVDVGFWFTFGASVALVVAATIANARRGSAAAHAGVTGATLLRVCVRAALMLLLATACVELALAPIGAYVFQRVTLAGLPLNFVALPAMTLVQLGAMGVLIADVLALPPLAAWCAHTVHLGTVALVDSARLLDVAPWLTWRVPSPSPVVLTFYYASLGGALLVRQLHAALPALILFLWIAAAPDARVRAHGDGRLTVTMLDVGQGDSLLVTFPNGRHLLLDTGGSVAGRFDFGDRVVGATLRARKLLSLDYLGVTHGDADHAGGGGSLIREFAPREVWVGVEVAQHEPTRVLRGEASRARAAWRRLQRGDRLELGGVELRVHHPAPADWERQRIRNNDSLVLELRYGRVSMLLAGDIEREVEDLLAPTLDLLPTVVLKVAHHGSATSSSAPFLHAIRPAIALIGVGRANPYGHPAPYVLGRLQDAGAEIFRTDLDGQIEVSTDGLHIWTTTFTGRRHYLRAAISQ
jgi:competence protein ComEC